METYHTLYEWCLLNNIRILDLDEKGNQEVDDYMLKKINKESFNEIIKEFEVKVNSTPRKPEKYLELRMYGFVPYNISPIQQAIQFGHAVQEYNNKYFNSDENDEFFRWRTEFKTFMILNGSTSNEGQIVRHGFKDEMYIGGMQHYLAELMANDIKVATFYEPDLNSMLTAIVFLVDERVFNKTLYPDFKSTPITYTSDVSDEQIESLLKLNQEQYKKWVEKIGGPKNEFLRGLLLGKKLA